MDIYDSNNYHPFVSAKPIWIENMQTEKHISLGLYACIDSPKEKVLLRIATSGFYRIFINGKFFFYGPARCAHGFFRVDELPLSVVDEKVHIAIEIVNHYINTYDYIRQPGFVQAEILCENKVLAASGCNGFSAFQLTERIQKVQRYSSQRPFAEAYRLNPDYNNWHIGQLAHTALKVATEETEEKELLPRRIPINTFLCEPFLHCESKGTFLYDVKPENYYKPRSLTIAGKPELGTLGGFKEEELDCHLSNEVQDFTNKNFVLQNSAYDNCTTIKDGEFEILSLKCEKTGFISAEIKCEKSGILYFLTDEILNSNNDVDPFRAECCNILKVEMSKGSYNFQTMNPIGFKYMKIMAVGGSFEIKNLCVRELICPQPVVLDYEGNDLKLKSIFDAARETFLQNSSDLFMDCPTRERAGWLCDSFFTARAEWVFTGQNVIEKNFLENYLLPKTFEHIPDGMVPMCYPADHPTGRFIPNWAMWFVLELEDRLFNRCGDKEFVSSFQNRVYSIVEWFEKYENSDGLLEKLPGWVFIEWSKANDLVQDINYPTNMLYARMLQSVARIFDDEILYEKSKKLKRLICERSFDGEFFKDNEVYDNNGKLCSTNERTETCQYYAFFSGVATPKTHKQLWERLVNEFGPMRSKTGSYKEVHPSNAFIGNYLRLFLLEENDLHDKCIEEIKEFFYYMAERTGTLWEHTKDYASCNHGFASCVAKFIVKK